MTTNGTVTAAHRRDPFASGAAVKLPLWDGDWVLVRAELTFGQERRLAYAGLTGIDAAASAGDRLRFDLAASEIEKLATWLLDWSFKDGDGDHIVLTRERIEALHPDTAKEITEALDKHIEALGAKKDPEASGPAKPAATSSSASASAGRGKS